MLNVQSREKSSAGDFLIQAPHFEFRNIDVGNKMKATKKDVQHVEHFEGFCQKMTHRRP